MQLSKVHLVNTNHRLNDYPTSLTNQNLLIESNNRKRRKIQLKSDVNRKSLKSGMISKWRRSPLKSSISQNIIEMAKDELSQPIIKPTNSEMLSSITRLKPIESQQPIDMPQSQSI